MARMTHHERDQIARARARGAHPEQPQRTAASHPAPSRVSLTDINPAALRRRADIERARAIGVGLQVLRAAASRFARRYLAGLVRKRLELRTRRELSALDDAILADIASPAARFAPAPASMPRRRSRG